MLRKATISDLIIITQLAILLWPDNEFNDLKQEMGGAYVAFPYDIRVEFGKGRVKVHATFDGEPYDEQGLHAQIEKGVDFEIFFAEAPQINPNAHKIKGVVCGVRVEEIEDPLMQKIRWLDKLVDELAKGRPMEKILRR